MRMSKSAKKRNKHRGSSVRDFLKQDGILEDVQAAAALKRAMALKVADSKFARFGKSGTATAL
jgi:hypothetical protein